MAELSRVDGLYERYGALVYRRAKRLLGDEQAAWDALQEVFVRALKHAPRFRRESSPATWLYRITTNYCLNVLRDSARHSRKLQVEADPSRMEPQRPPDGTQPPTKVFKQVGVNAPVMLAELDDPYFSSLQFSSFQLSAGTLYMRVLMGGVFGIYAVPLDGGDVRLAAPLPGTSDSTPYWLVAEPYIYFITYPDDSSVNCSLKRIAIDGEASSQEGLMLCPTIQAPKVRSPGRGELWKVAKAGGAATSLYSASDPRLAIPAHAAVLDAQKLYFQIGAPSFPAQIPAKLMSIPKTAGSPAVFYDGPYVSNGVQQLAQDDSNLFMGLGLIMFLPKMPAAQ